MLDNGEIILEEMAYFFDLNLMTIALQSPVCAYLFVFVLNKSLPARLKATTRQEASRKDRTDFTNTKKDIG